jgi:hypothetical protein
MQPLCSALCRGTAVLAGALALAAVGPASAGAVAKLLPGQAGLRDLDGRTGRLTPTAGQTSEVSSLGARAQ